MNNTVYIIHPKRHARADCEFCGGAGENTIIGEGGAHLKSLCWCINDYSYRRAIRVESYNAAMERELLEMPESWSGKPSNWQSRPDEMLRKTAGVQLARAVRHREMWRLAAVVVVIVAIAVAGLVI